MAETKKFCIHSDGLGYCDILSDDTVHHYCVEGPCPHEIIVEYAPVKHGRWDFVDQCFRHGGFIDIYLCTSCGLSDDRRSLFCPNCGAKMDLEVTNGLDQH